LKILLLMFLILFSAVISYSQTAIVISENTLLRGEPSETGEVVDTLVRDTKVQIMKQKGPWFLVQASPFVGWVHGNSIRLKRSSKAAPIIRQTSKSNPDTQQSAASTSLTPQPVVRPSQSAGPADLSSTTKTLTITSPSKDGRVYIRGPLGGCYFRKTEGKKVYVDHGFCN
jgi:uncharacterized protein YgiM (DUF1202 family)